MRRKVEIQRTRKLQGMILYLSCEMLCSGVVKVPEVLSRRRHFRLLQLPRVVISTVLAEDAIERVIRGI